ncbi:MAG: hypothetical protein J0L61_02860 [Planctomycetes bacterium]|nr:hypothetical protein [Planctomycetota bacterium]
MRANLNAGRRVRLAFGVAALVAMSGAAFAQPLDRREMAIAMESTLVDLDLAAIGFHHGRDVGRSLSYASYVDESGWQGRLWGTYSGRDVDVYYTGTIAPLRSAQNQYALSYVSEWLIDGRAGSGSGAATYYEPVDPRAPDFNFKIDWLNMTVSGDVSVSYGVATLTLSGSKDFPNHMMTVSGGAAVLDLPLLGAAADASISLELDQLTGEYRSTLSAQVLFGLIEAQEEINRGTIRKPRTPNPPPPVPPPRYPANPPTLPYPTDSDPGPLPPSGGANTNMIATTVPSPGSGLLMAVGGGLLLAHRRQRPAA